MLRKRWGGSLQVFGGIALNRSVGGLNPALVEVELQLGAKEVWLPTQSAVADSFYFKRDLTQAVPITDEKGKYLPELIEILDMIAKKDVILGTGHLSSPETEKLVPVAKERGVKKILVQHPEYPVINMPIDMQKRLVRQGVYMERCYINLFPPRNTFQYVIEKLNATGVEFSVMATDFGRADLDEQVVGMRNYGDA
jgi:hypothetical protein